ncbi:MAG: Hsp20/alpha crystallin family protein [Coriobacteriia bacterium]|nr:Hsp20/alpha crystallin family protein [Coriobacteriia bacterium]
MRWDPFGEMISMQREMDRLFGRMGMRRGDGGEAGQMHWVPRIEAKREGDDLVIKAELPGMKPEDVDISVEDNVLTIKGERKAEEKKEGEDYVIREFSYGSFERSMVLPESVKPEDIKAGYDNGVLEVRVPRAMEEAKPKATKIPIGAGKGK